MSFSGKVAVVTGGGNGIGRASAILFAREGAKVVVADVAVETGTETVRLILESSGEATFVAADVSRSDQVQAAVDHALSIYGRLDIAHNNDRIERPHFPIADCS